MKRTIAAALVAALSLTACENTLARRYGGTTHVDAKAGHKVVNITWKGDNLWILTRPMHEGEQAETLTFSESSTYGVLQGHVVVRERAAQP